MNIAFAAELDLGRDDKGEVISPTVEQIIPLFNSYIIDVHRNMQE